MREIEIKAHVIDVDGVKAFFDSIAGKGNEVHKKDTYLKDDRNLLRVRVNNGEVETTTKKTRKDSSGNEDNLEYELKIKGKSVDAVIAFFNALGYRYYFTKLKNGYDWYVDSVHVELLSVNDLGWFLELESLIGFSSDDTLVEKEREKIHSLLISSGVKPEQIEPRSYRSMILKEF